MKTKITACVAAIAIFASGVATAATYQRVSAEVRSDVKIVVDGTEYTLRDANSKVVYPLMVEGTTYVPLRAMGGIMGKEVGWDEESATVTLGTPAPKKEYALPGEIAMSQNGVTLFFTGELKTESISQNRVLEVEIENTSDVDQNISLDKVSVNRYSCIGYLGIMKIEAGKKQRTSITITGSSLEGNKIDKIESIESSFTLRATNDYVNSTKVDALPFRFQ